MDDFDEENNRQTPAEKHEVDQTPNWLRVCSTELT